MFFFISYITHHKLFLPAELVLNHLFQRGICDLRISHERIDSCMYTSDEVPDGRNAAPPDSSACEGGFPHLHDLAQSRHGRNTKREMFAGHFRRQASQQMAAAAAADLPTVRGLPLLIEDSCRGQKTAFLTIRRQSGEFGSPSPHSPSLLYPLTGFPRRPRASS